MQQERLKLFAQIASAATVSVLAVAQLAPNVIDDAATTVEPTRTEQFLDRLDGGALQVLPANGRPVPIDTPLQSSRNQSDQEAAGELQQPQSDLQQGQDGLQPSATSEQLPDDFDF